MKLALYLLIQLATSFYVPGVTPRDYKANEGVDLHVNALSSLKKSVSLVVEYYKQPRLTQSDHFFLIANTL